MVSITLTTSLTVSLVSSLIMLINRHYFGVECDLLQALFLIALWLITVVCFMFDGFIQAVEMEADL